MVELDKKDIEVVAQRRFNKHYWRHIVGYCIGLIALTVVLAIVVPEEVGLGIMLAFMSPVFIVYLGSIHYCSSI